MKLTIFNYEEDEEDEEEEDEEEEEEDEEDPNRLTDGQYLTHMF